VRLEFLKTCPPAGLRCRQPECRQKFEVSQTPAADGHFKHDFKSIKRNGRTTKAQGLKRQGVKDLALDARPRRAHQERPAAWEGTKFSTKFSILD
jgi:hypothetical protein